MDWWWVSSALEITILAALAFGAGWFVGTAMSAMMGAI